MTERRDALEQLVGPVSRETWEALLSFEAALLRWNRRINLVSQSTLDHLWVRHVLDSAQLWPHIATTQTFADFGSGGGFPGAILAILMKPDTSQRVHLIESNQKKAAFLTTILADLEVDVTIHASRIETAVLTIQPPEVLTARAFAPLQTILELAHPWWSAGTRALLHKGRNYAREIAEAGDVWAFDLIEHPSVTEPGAVILDLRNVHRTG